jgi:DNA repair protein RadC
MKGAMSITAVFELANRKQSNLSLKRKIKKSIDAYEIFRPCFSDLIHEEFYTAFLNRANQVIRVELLSRGGLNGTVVDVRIIMNRAVLHKASAIIVAHNHPSENLVPSEQDKALTKRLKEACVIFEMQLIDHLILGNNHYFSFADEGII